LEAPQSVAAADDVLDADAEVSLNHHDLTFGDNAVVDDDVHGFDNGSA
jgi:hypothetical protein